MRDGWKALPLSAVVEHTIGGVWGGESGTDEVEVTVVRSTEFTKRGYLNFETGVSRSIKLSQLKSRELKVGDILLEKSGGGPDQPVGRVVYVTGEIPKKFVCSNFVQLVRPNSIIVEPLLLFHIMWQWHAINRTLEFQAQTTGIRNLRTPDYLEQEINLPPLTEQKRIVDLISSVDSYIESLQNQLESATRSRNAILHELLTVGGDDWVETPIGDVAEVLSGFAFKSNLFNKSAGIPLIRIRDLPKRNSTEALYSGSYEDRYIVKKGDFLIGMDGEFHCYEWNGPDALLNQRVCRIQDFKIGKVVPRYIYFAVNQYLDKIEQDTGYTTVKHISAKQVLGIKIPLPPLLEQKRIVGIISEMDDFIESIQRTLVKAKSLRSGLLSDLLIGAHEIPVGYDKVMDAAR